MSLVRGENSLFFAIGLDNEKLERDAQEATEIITKSALEISKLSKEAIALLQSELKAGIGKDWLKNSFDLSSMRSSPFFDQLGKLIGGELRFDAGELSKLCKALDAAQNDTEATCALVETLKEKIARLGGSSSLEMRKLSSGVALVSHHLKAMGVGAEEVYGKLLKVQKYTPGNYTGVSDHFKKVHKDNLGALNASSISSIGDLKSTLSGVLGKDLSLSNREFASLNALLHKSQDAFEKLIVLVGFFKEKIAQSPKAGSQGLNSLSLSIKAIEDSLKKCGVEASSVFKGLKDSSFVDVKSLKKTQELTLELTQLQKAQEGIKQSTSSLSLEYRQMIEAMAQMRRQGKEGEEGYDRLKEKATLLKGAISSVNNEVRSSSTGNEGLSSVISSVNGLVGVFGAAQGGAALFGGESKEMEATLIKLNGALTVLNSLSAVQASINDRNSLTFKGLCYVQGLYATALDASAAASTRLAAASKLLGVGLIIAAVVAAVSALQKLSETMDRKNKLARLSIDIEKEAKKSALKESVHIKMIYDQLRMSNLSREKQNQLIKELNDLMPEMNGAIDQESIKSGKAAKAIEEHTKAIEKRALARAIEDKEAELLRQRLNIEMAPDEDYLNWGQKGIHKLMSFFDKEGAEKYMNTLKKMFASKNKAEALKIIDELIAKVREYNKKLLKEGLLDSSSPQSDKKERKQGDSLQKNQEKELEKLGDIKQEFDDKQVALEEKKQKLIINRMQAGMDKELALLKLSLEQKKEANKKDYQQALKHINTLKHLSEKQKAPAKEEARLRLIESNKVAQAEHDEKETKIKLKYDPRTLSGISKQIQTIEDKIKLAISKEAVVELEKKKNVLEVNAELMRGMSASEIVGLDIKKQSLSFINKELEKQREIVKEKQKAYDLTVSKHGAESPEALAAQKELNKEKAKDLELIDTKKEKLAQVGKVIQSSADQLKTLLSSLGMDPQSKEGEKVNSLLDLASGAGEIFSGAMTKNPAAMISGGIKAVSALLKTHVVSDTKKYEENVRSLGDAFSVLSAKMENLRGEDKMKNYDNQIKNQKEQIEQRKKAIQAEMQARKESLLGDKGSGTNWKKIKELEKANELAEEALKKLDKQKKEALLGVSEGSLMDGFLSSLEKGKEAMSSFEEGFDDMIRKVFLSKIKTYYLEKQISDLWKDMAQKVESQEGLSDRDVQALRDKGRGIFEGAQQKARQMGQLLEEMNIKGGLFNPGKQKKEGLSGAIKAVTEETADKLSGLLNNMRITQLEGLSAQHKMCYHLLEIQTNTACLKNIDRRLANIESAFSAQKALGR